MYVKCKNINLIYIDKESTSFYKDIRKVCEIFLNLYLIPPTLCLLPPLSCTANCANIQLEVREE